MIDDSEQRSPIALFYEPFWNFMQLFAWVYTREPDLIHRASSNNSLDEGISVSELSVLRVLRLLREGKYDPDSVPAGITFRDITDALCKGRFSATGIPAGGKIPEKIQADDWAFLELFESDRHEICARFCFEGPHQYEMRYSALKVRRDELLTIWPSWEAEVESAKGAAESKPMPRQRLQEQEIIRVLCEGGFDPKSIPRNSRGKPGMKKWTRERLPGFTPAIHKLAWERLLKAGDLGFSKVTLKE